MTADVIKEFLVGLGFGVDDASLAKFNKAVASATLKVTAMYTATKVMAAGIFYGISKISEGFEQLGYEYRIIAPAINKALILRRELLKAYSAAGINITKVVQASVRLNFSLAKTKFAFEAIYKSVASRFFELITKQSDAFRKKLYDNLPKIQNYLERFIQLVFKTVDAMTSLALRLFSIFGRIYDVLVKLDTATNGWSTAILAIVAAWKLLNLSFLATPLGLIISGFVALLALWDDLQTFKEGGQSLFDWSVAVIYIEDVTNALASLWNMGKRVVSVFGEIASYLSNTAIVKGIIDIGAGVAKFFSGPGVAANVAQGGAGAGFFAQPLGAGNTDNSRNQNVSQQTAININGVPDANAVGKAVAGEQSRVNFDLVRNLRSPTR